MDNERKIIRVRVNELCGICNDKRRINFLVEVECDVNVSPEEAAEFAFKGAREKHLEEHHRN